MKRIATTLPPQLVRLRDGTLRELGREFCSLCLKPMPDPESGEECWSVPGCGVFHGGCCTPPRRPEIIS